MLTSMTVRATLIAIACMMSLPAHAMANPPKQVDIPAGDLRQALLQASELFSTDLVYETEQLKGLRTKGVSGTFSAHEAVTKLLEGTPLQLRTDEASGAILITTPASSEPAGTQGANTSPNSSPRSGEEGARLREGEGIPGEGKERGFWSRFRLAQNDQGEPSSSSKTDERDNQNPLKDSDEQMGEIVVTGSHIRGAAPASPVLTITQQEMRLSGHNNLGEVIRAVPQNFSGGQNPGVAIGAATGASSANFNTTGSSSLNLRGLGPDATLTLLNGTRLPYDGSSQATDVSVIPVAAIERVEILLDGASAIYGSDAVGGVANIILKRDYDGGEVSARYGGATDGGYEQQQYTGVAGTNWGSGGFLITGDYSDNDPVKARQRDTLSHMTNQNVDIYPESTQKSALLSGHQELGGFATFNLDAFYTERSQEELRQTSASSFSEISPDSSIWGVAPSLDFALPGDWSARLHGAFSRNESERTFAGFSVATGLQTSKNVAEFFNGMQAAGIELEGPLFALPGGDARASTGGGYRRNTFDTRSTNLITGAISGVTNAEESSYYVYGEVDLPLVSEAQNIPLMNRLTLNAAVRHENYDSFDASTTPKIGAIWGLAPGFDLKASWGRSFKVPTLQQQHADSLLALFPPALLGAPGAPADAQVLFFSSGSNPGLTPETAEIITAGFVARPEFLPGLTLEFGYFDIDYTDRVAQPIDLLSQALSNPAFAAFVTLNPTTAQQSSAFAASGLAVGTFLPGFNVVGAPYDPAKVIAIADNRNTNVASHRVRGVDLTARYTTELLGGDLALSGNGSWITDGTRKLQPGARDLPAAGVNFWPAKFKGRLAAGWSREGFSLNANLNYIAGIIDRNVTPNVKRDSITTVDLIVDYQWISDLVGDVGFNLAVTNLLNEAPPFLQPALPTFYVNYDSTNYSALGRVISATITKRF